MSESKELVTTTNDSMALQSLPTDADAATTPFEAEEIRLADYDMAGGLHLIMRAGGRYARLKDASVHGRFMRVCKDHSAFSHRTITGAMRIARDPNILRVYEDPASRDPNWPAGANLLLPSDMKILEELCGLEPETFDGMIEDGVIHVEMKRGDVKRAQVAAAHADPAVEAAPLPEGTYGAILADPPWHFQAFGAGGTDRSPENHYPTMRTDDIAALPVGDLAAQHCALFLWTTSAMLLDALTVMQSWGFQYRSTAFIWMKKGGFGLGYWTRKDAEICLLGIKGSPKRLNADVREGILTERRKHSEKPAEIYRRIERLVSGPYMELFARKAHLGWNRWGNDPTLAVPPPIRGRSDPAGKVIPDGEVDETHSMPGLKKHERCEIQLHRDRERGLWMWGTRVQFEGGGHGYQVGPKWGQFAKERAHALHWAFDELKKMAGSRTEGDAVLKRIAKWEESLK